MRFYEFMSQIDDYDDKDLEKLSLYARNPRPMLQEIEVPEDDIKLSNMVLSQYRLSKIRQYYAASSKSMAKDFTCLKSVLPDPSLGTSSTRNQCAGIIKGLQPA